jgi:hypothetical protein
VGVLFIQGPSPNFQTDSIGPLSFWERELSGVSDEAVLLRNVMRKKVGEVLCRKISELDRSPLLLGEG